MFGDPQHVLSLLIFFGLDSHSYYDLTMMNIYSLSTYNYYYTTIKQRNISLLFLFLHQKMNGHTEIINTNKKGITNRVKKNNSVRVVC